VLSVFHQLEHLETLEAGEPSCSNKSTPTPTGFHQVYRTVCVTHIGLVPELDVTLAISAIIWRSREEC
jgi:hypothetical protein